jgi:MFS family permease
LRQSFFLPGTALAVLGLGINCTIGYGSLFYSFSLLSVEFEQHFGWSKEFIFAVFSIGTFCGGLIAPFWGKCLDRYNARYLLSAGSFFVAIALCLLSRVYDQASFIAALILVEVIGTFVLYESAFVAITKIAGKKARYPITQITLMAGFASTIFWPFISWLLTWMSWRDVYLLLALLHLLICLPLHWYVLSSIKTTSSTNIQSGDDEEFDENSIVSTKSQWLLASALGIGAFAITAVQVHLFHIFKALSVTSAIAIVAGVLIGPSQVAARVIDMVFAQKVTPIILGMISFGAMAIGILGLLSWSKISALVWVFAISFGAGQGLAYIVRGAAPLYLFGDKNYGHISGQLNSVRMILTAIAPFSFALLMQKIGVYYSLIFIFLLMLISILILRYLTNTSLKNPS